MNLPYYSMYPADFDTDERVRVMEDCELGLYVRCLNHSWMNNGLPVDDEEIRRLFRDNPEEFARKWKRVGACFPVAEDGRRRNPRQEKERATANAKVNRTKRANETREERARLRDENVNVNREERGTRAYDSDSVSGGVADGEGAGRGATGSTPPGTSAATPSVLPILEGLQHVYTLAGVPIAEKHKQQAVQYLIDIPPERRGRVLDYCKWALATGKWPNPAKTKSLLNLLRDGDWDVELTPRVLPILRPPSAKQSVLDAAEDRFLRGGR